MSQAPTRCKRPRLAWVLPVAMAIATTGCFNGNGNGMRDRRPRRGGHSTAETPTEADLAAIRGHLEAARAAVPDLPPAEQGRMSQALDRAEAALDRYERLAGQGATRRRRTGQIYMAGGFVLANDASGVGAADDWVLPFLLVGLIATHLTTEAPAPPADVAQAWGEVIAGLEAVGKTAEGIRAAGQRVSPMPPMDDCVVHVQECMASSLSRKRGGKHGRSVCVDCVEICRRQGSWPRETWDGKDCQWWNY